MPKRLGGSPDRLVSAVPSGRSGLVQTIRRCFRHLVHQLRCHRAAGAGSESQTMVHRAQEVVHPVHATGEPGAYYFFINSPRYFGSSRWEKGFY